MFQVECRGGHVRAAARVGSLAAMLLAAWTAVGAAQVKPPPPPLKRELPQVPRPDLAIASIDFQEVLQGTPVIIAKLNIRNQGTADAVLVGAIASAGIPGKPDAAPFTGGHTQASGTLKPGEVRQIGMTLGLCLVQASNLVPVDLVSPVQFVVDPGNSVAESNEDNNTLTATLPLSITAAALFVRYVRLRSPQGPAPSPPNDSAGWSYLASDLVIHVQNTGKGPALWCPNRMLLREASTPVAARHPLHSVINQTGQPIFIPAGQAYVATLPNAVYQNELAPGSYTWRLQLNPQHGIVGTSPAEPSAHVVWLK